jgi:hypothetical protein
MATAGADIASPVVVAAVIWALAAAAMLAADLVAAVVMRAAAVDVLKAADMLVVVDVAAVVDTQVVVATAVDIAKSRRIQILSGEAHRLRRFVLSRRFQGYAQRARKTQDTKVFPRNFLNASGSEGAVQLGHAMRIQVDTAGFSTARLKSPNRVTARFSASISNRSYCV